MRERRLLYRFWITENTAFKVNGSIMGRNRHKFMAEALEVGGKLAELTRKILMNQQDPHKSNP